ncbi:hypothetical protein AGMMS50212_00560 [Spirochaetia bacterium]|nr:hypothetical protein AGMMS50212_00560 [Spirochaetia bacterium]
MEASKFDTSIADSQGTFVEAIPIDSFDVDRYAEYCAALEKRCTAFQSAPDGCLVHRRFRVPQVFAGACRDMAVSLSLQLGALQKSMDFVMDVPNFLEPWYGIGAVPGAFGAEYIWHGDTAPATVPIFKNVEAALACEPKEIADTPAGKHILNMIDFFLEHTRGRLPMSFSDVQSPLDVAAALVVSSEFYMAVLEDPEAVSELLEIIAALSVNFYQKQAAMIGDSLVFPGHGFASSRSFNTGPGLSDDNSIMLSPENHKDVCSASMNRLGEPFGGFAFHSCGNWSKRAAVVRSFPGIRMADAAFTPRTDPSPNPPGPLRDAFANTGLILNARMVGGGEEVLQTLSELVQPGMKLILVSYCADKEEQKRLYEGVKSLT